MARAYLKYEALDNGHGLCDGSIDTKNNVIQQHLVDSGRMTHEVLKLYVQYGIITSMPEDNKHHNRLTLTCGIQKSPILNMA